MNIDARIARKTLIILLTEFLIMVCVCYSENISAINNPFDVMSILQDRLSGNRLNYKEIHEGMEIPLDSLIVLPPLKEKPILSITFSLSVVDEDFITDFFLEPNRRVIDSHYFSLNGIEPNLLEDHLLLNIYGGVILNLRNKANSHSNSLTFKKSDIFASVISVNCKAYVSFDHSLIRENFSEFIVQWYGFSSGKHTKKNLSGDYVEKIPFNEAVPPKFAPKITKKGVIPRSVIKD